MSFLRDTKSKENITKSLRALSLEKFVRSADRVLTSKFGCKVKVCLDEASLKNATLPTEYFTQAINTLAILARARGDAQIEFSTEKNIFIMQIKITRAAYDSFVSHSHLTESCTDLCDVSYSFYEDGDMMCAELRAKIKLSHAAVLYAISKDEFYELLVDLLS